MSLSNFLTSLQTFGSRTIRLIFHLHEIYRIVRAMDGEERHPNSTHSQTDSLTHDEMPSLASQ
jgi:hypothetical protein